MPPLTRPVGRSPRCCFFQWSRQYQRQLSSTSQLYYADPPPASRSSTAAPTEARQSRISSNTIKSLIEHLGQSNVPRPVSRNSASRSFVGANDDALRNINSSRLQPGRSSSPNTAALQRHSRQWARSASETVDTREKEIGLRRRVGRIWKLGDVYAPRDLGATEQKKWRNRYNLTGRRQDVFDMIGKSPLSFYRNFALLSEFTTETGRIKHGEVTGLKRTNQRKIAKAIRRSIGLGLLPSVHHHPMILGRDVGIARSVL